MKNDRIATYRVQLTPAFGLGAAAGLAPYLEKLGTSHLYTSPSLQATTGSTSGYDVVDPTRVNEELGGEAAHERLEQALRAHGLAWMIDIVPNHMAISGGENPWWRDVLRNGPSSRYAAWFDVDWAASEEHWPNRVLLPVLNEQFGRELEAGAFRLDRQSGRFTLWYRETPFPVEPSSTSGLLAEVAEETGEPLLGFLADSLARLPRPTAAHGTLVERRHRDQVVLANLLDRLCQEQPAIGSAIDRAVARLNGDSKQLGELIERQNYRLAHWRAADLDLGYRRFFNINDLAGLRVELPEVFAAVHQLPLQWIREGSVQALRVDHPDGLRDPAEYCQRLRDAAPDAWIVIEKILEPGEKLREDWPIEGTTGYDFANLVQGLFVDPSGEEALTRFYDEWTESDRGFEEVARESKRSVLTDLLGSEVNRLTSLLRDICERHWRHRDHTRAVLFEALVAVASSFHVYRTYVRPGQPVAEEDAKRIREATAEAAKSEPEIDGELFEFLQRLLLLDVEGELERAFAVRFQQLTGPAMAKGIEDTAFYRYFRLTALNEVGGNPGKWGILVEDFHVRCAEAHRDRPWSLLATSTHDTKRGEDVRARLLVLSELPNEWKAASARWRDHNARHRSERFDRNTEYLYYQTLVGAWPIDRERMTAYLEKAVREGKEHSDWTRIDEAYEAEMRSFVERTLGDRDFVDDLEQFVERIRPAGRINSLAQTLIKLTAPGVPDIYQGCELWDLSLVDPDNRRPVDFAHREALLDQLDKLSPAEIMERMDEGLPKLWLIRETLRLRRARQECFDAGGSYELLAVEGREAARVVAFVRGGGVACVVPRLGANLGSGWADTQVRLPPGRWRNRLDSETAFGGAALPAELFAAFPVALLEKEG